MQKLKISSRHNELRKRFEGVKIKIRRKSMSFREKKYIGRKVPRTMKETHRVTRSKFMREDQHAKLFY